MRDESVDLIATSPPLRPYLWKRKYAIDGPGELGNERDWREFLANLFAVTDELLRVLKPSGSIWVQLGDTRVTGTEPKWLGIPVKSRLLLPERYRIGCQDRYARQGVIVRQVQIHDKANGLPESIDDRTRDSHEDWVHIVRRPDYYSAVDAIREDYSRNPSWGDRGNHRYTAATRGDAGALAAEDAWSTSDEHPLGKLPGSVWRLPSEPLVIPAAIKAALNLPDHYAAFGTEVVRRIVLAWSPPGICTGCGQGRVPVVDRKQRPTRPSGEARIGKPYDHSGPLRVRTDIGNVRTEAAILGYACACTPFTDHPERRQPSLTPDGHTGTGYMRDGDAIQAARVAAGMRRTHMDGWPERPPVRDYHLDGWHPPPTRPAVILDPFSGTGTTPMVARALGRHGIGVDLSADYLRLATWRVWHSGSWQDVIARTSGRRLPKLKPHDPGQQTLEVGA